MARIGSILEACIRLDRPAVLATVVRVEGSAYRRPGARMLIGEQGETRGMVSGGCLETDLADRARKVLDLRTPETVVYDMRSPDDIVWGLGLGCDGEVRVLLERVDPASPPEWCRFAASARERRIDVAIATVFESAQPGAVGARLWIDGDREIHGGTGSSELDREIAGAGLSALAERRSRNATWEISGAHHAGLIEIVRPPVQLYVFGAGADAGPVVDQALDLGWKVALFDHREPALQAGRFSRLDELHCIDPANFDPAQLQVDDRSAILLMTHHFLHDLQLLEALLELPAAYLGVLGPRRRLARLLEELAGQGRVPTAEATARLHGPVGLDIGSETPQEIALSALAEIQAVLSGRAGGSLRVGESPLHDWPR